jgi:hypothetical protein
VKVLTPEGTSHSLYSLWGRGGKDHKVDSVQGWNLPPKGALTKIDRRQVLQIDPDGRNKLTQDLRTVAGVSGVVPGSIIAFESVETLGPDLMQEIEVAERDPILRWELAADTPWFLGGGIKVELGSRNLESWAASVETQPGKSLILHRVRGRNPSLGGLPGSYDCLAKVFLCFDDGKPTAMQGRSGEALGKDAFALMQDPGPLPVGLPALSGEPLAQLESLGAWMARTFTYRQVYLAPNRGYKPLPPAQTLRQRAGDCKDLATVAIAMARKAGLEGFPVLARIGDGVLAGEVPQWNFMINHVIAAIRVPAAVDVPAAVVVDGAHYLLYDPTARTTPLGFLPGSHRNAKLLLCLPTGGRWVEVPARAIEPANVAVAMEGAMLPGNRLHGTLTLQETGDALGLADAYLAGGGAALRAALAPVLALNAASTFTVLGSSDPLIFGRPFEIRVALELEGVISGRGILALPGLPPLARPIQPVEQPRLDAIQVGADAAWTWTCALDGLDRGLTHPGLALRTPLRELLWRGAREGGRLRLTLGMGIHRRAWTRSQAQEGLRVVDEDRFAFLAFREKCLALE